MWAVPSLANQSVATTCVLMAAGNDVPTPSESGTDVPVRHIPGFYYDEKLKRYFKILKPEKEPNANTKKDYSVRPGNKTLHPRKGLPVEKDILRSHDYIHSHVEGMFSWLQRRRTDILETTPTTHG